MNPLSSMSLADLKLCGTMLPVAARFAERMLVDDYASFVRVLYLDLDDCVVEIERNRELRKKSGEDVMSVQILAMLKILGYATAHEQKTGGHVDLTVTHCCGFEWLGEAKIHSSYDYLLKGFQQLCTRYSTGSPIASSGGLLTYIYNTDVASVMAQWRERLKAEEFPDFADWDCPIRTGLSFFSNHKHELSGLPYTVRHMAVMLFHEPKDSVPGSKSRRRASPKKTKKASP